MVREAVTATSFSVVGNMNKVFTVFINYFVCALLSASLPPPSPSLSHYSLIPLTSNVLIDLGQSCQHARAAVTAHLSGRWCLLCKSSMKSAMLFSLLFIVNFNSRICRKYI